MMAIEVEAEAEAEVEGRSSTENREFASLLD
jgi:hypothetical protein